MTNEPLKQLFIDTVNQTKEGIAKAVEIAMREMPELCNQILRFEIVRGTFACIGCIALIVILCWVGKRILKGEDEYMQPFCVFPFGAALIPAFLFYLSICNVMKAWLAPKLFLIEYAANLLK